MTRKQQISTGCAVAGECLVEPVHGLVAGSDDGRTGRHYQFE